MIQALLFLFATKCNQAGVTAYPFGSLIALHKLSWAPLYIITPCRHNLILPASAFNKDAYLQADSRDMPIRVDREYLATLTCNEIGREHDGLVGYAS